ncbi:MAG: type IIL restriction-modification enzyme MmeI [Gammaproteobacteria bacterium]
MAGEEPAIGAFIERWRRASGTEKSNYQLFLTELTEALGLPRPEPASDSTRENAYVFERRVTFQHGDGSESHGFIDLYRRGHFVCEAKQTGEQLGSGRWDSAMLRARGQAEQYARALPADEGRPPFLIVTDVGRSLELYSEFTRTGGTYVPFPDPRTHRISLEDLRREDIRQRLKLVWTDPLSLDPTRQSAKVTRDIATKLASLARSLEDAGHPSDTVAAFLMRALFTMFAEDVGLMGKGGFTELLQSLRDEPPHFVPLVQELWRAMNAGGFSTSLREQLLRFNGGLFADQTVLPLDREQIELLIDAGRADWRYVEPAIFGTLLERALDPEERHALGAHYTPRAYVERLVLPTIIEPLREEWSNAQAAAMTLDRAGNHKEAVTVIRDFHQRLCKVRVLDPACGSGNFLYVTLEHLKRMEGEVLNTLADVGETRGLLELEGVTVDPHQLLGLEVNPRAARIAEAVLWIGYLQWHFRTYGNVMPPQPVLKDFHNIECRDAVLAWDRVEYVKDDAGQVVTRWDGKTMKKHHVTGEDVPDDSARVPLERYVGPRKATWPPVDFVIGNPPFIGTKRMRMALGDGYVDALRGTWNDVPDSADFVMYWWHKAAAEARSGAVRRFGLITTNSVRQSFNRRVVEHHLQAKPPLSLVFAIPDHPWVDSADGAAVRIAMTVGEAGIREGVLRSVIDERAGDGEGVEVDLETRTGMLHADLKVGANIAVAVPMVANERVSGMGVALHGSGFIVEPDLAARLRSHGPAVIRGYLGGRDLLQVPRERYLIDFSGMSEEEARIANPAAFQHVIDYVKPERDHNARDSIRTLWWRFGWERPLLRNALRGLSRYIGTTETAKHRMFQFIDGKVLADHMVVCVASDDAYVLGVLSSRLHVCWALAAGGRLGVGNDPRYNKTKCFDTFPFPVATDDDKLRIRRIAEDLDAHRKRQQSLNPGLTLTGVYNVMEKIRGRDELTDGDRAIHEQGLVSVLIDLHDQLDTAVFKAYGWSDLGEKLVGRPGATTPLPDLPAGQAGDQDELLRRLVALNAERAAEESRGLIRWLRPSFQSIGGATVQTEMEAGGEPAEKAAPAAVAGKQPWPKTLPDQVQAVRNALARQPRAASAEQIARTFKHARTDTVAELLDTLAALGQVRRSDDGLFTAY